MVVGNHWKHRHSMRLLTSVQFYLTIRYTQPSVYNGVVLYMCFFTACSIFLLYLDDLMRAFKK